MPDPWKPPFGDAGQPQGGSQHLWSLQLQLLQRIAVGIENYSTAFDNWTPAIDFATTGDLAVAYSVQDGQFVKSGRLVSVKFAITTSSFTHTSAAGNLRITGLPYAADANAAQGIGTVSWSGITKAGYTDLQAVSVASASYLEFVMSQSGAAISSVDSGDVPTAGTVVLNGMAIYVAAP